MDSGPDKEKNKEQTQKREIYLLEGSCGEAAFDGKIYNTSLFYSPEGSFKSYGNSMAISPWGEILARVEAPLLFDG